MIVNLLSNPRNVSTALMYSFAQHEDFRVIDEPFYAYYLQRSGVDHPGGKETLSSQPTDLQTIFEQIERAADGSRNLFLKNMAHHVHDVDKELFLPFFNLIFIRDPQEVLASFSKVIEKPTIEDIAIKYQYEFFQYFEKTGARYCILDINTLLKKPRKALSEIFAKMNIPWSEKMLTWPEGPKPYDGVWSKFWYANVHRSNGFQPKGHYGKNPLAPHLHPVLEEAQPYYQALQERAIQV